MLSCHCLIPNSSIAKQGICIFFAFSFLLCIYVIYLQLYYQQQLVVIFSPIQILCLLPLVVNTH